LRLSLNESPFPPEEESLSLLARYGSRANLYIIEELHRDFMEALSRYVGIDEEFLDVYPGSSYLIVLMLIYAKVRGLPLVMPYPSFHPIYRLAGEFGVEVVNVPLGNGDFSLDPSLLLEAGRGKIVYFSNPNNPTSNLLVSDVGLVRELSEEADSVFIDEAYYEFSGVTLKDLVRELGNLVIVRTFSKAFSLAGIRLGYGILGDVIRRRLKRLRIGYEVSVLSEAMGLGALRSVERMRERVKEICRVRDSSISQLRMLGVRVAESRTNFLFIDVGTDCRYVRDELKARGIEVLCFRDVEVLGKDFPTFIRVTVGSEKDMRYFTASLEEILSRVSR